MLAGSMVVNNSQLGDKLSPEFVLVLTICLLLQAASMAGRDGALATNLEIAQCIGSSVELTENHSSKFSF